MSSAPTVLDTLPMTLPRLAEKKRLGEPIVMVTAYDHPSARVADAAGVDLVLVGDSAANVVLGYGSTVPGSVEEPIMLSPPRPRRPEAPVLGSDLPLAPHDGLPHPAN